MAKRFWKCWRCQDENAPRPGYDFTADDPVCPKCKTNGETTEGKDIVIARMVLHFEPPSDLPGVGSRIVACSGLPTPTTPVRCTGEPHQVNCPACRATEAWKQAKEKWDRDPAYEVPEVPLPSES